MWLALALLIPQSAFAFELAPYKDRLFAYPGTLKAAPDKSYRVIDYDEYRDINERDQVPERRVHSQYISLRVRREQSDLVLETVLGPIRHFAVGRREGATVITIYIHGQGGSRKQGVNDFTFGGNFNRIKNLMARNGGLYLSPDFPDFGDAGSAAVAALVSYYHKASPTAPVFVACGSMGGEICFRLAARTDMSAMVSGYILLGTAPNTALFSSPAFHDRTPLFLGHGSRDVVFPVEASEEFFRKLKNISPGYPAHFVRFETGTHGTPIRMIDWRETINWMLSTE